MEVELTEILKEYLEERKSQEIEEIAETGKMKENMDEQSSFKKGEIKDITGIICAALGVMLIVMGAALGFTLDTTLFFIECGIGILFCLVSVKKYRMSLGDFIMAVVIGVLISALFWQWLGL